MPSKALTAAEGTDIEQTVREVLGEVLSEVSDELSSPAGEPPAHGRPSRASARMSARSAAAPPPSDTSPGNGAVSPEVSDAVEAVLRDLSPEQAQTLASLFEAIGEHGDEDEPEPAAAGDAAIELGSMSDAKAQGKIIAQGGVDKILQLLWRNRGLFKAAAKAAMAGARSFRKWVNALSNLNPVKWAIKLLPSYMLSALIDRIVAEWQRATAGRAIASRRTSDAEPEDIEHVVRRVLSEALTEPQEGLRAH